MAITSVKSSTAVQASNMASMNYGPALAVLTTLFFIWGSLTSLNDVLIPFAQHVFSLKLAASMLIQTAFFSAYFIFSIPSAKIIDWIGYKRAIIVGLSTMVAACLLFYPAAKIPSFPFFLTALMVLAAGITVLQVAAKQADRGKRIQTLGGLTRKVSLVRTSVKTLHRSLEGLTQPGGRCSSPAPRMPA